MKIRKIAICGGGKMGQGIARTIAQYGYDVVIKEKNAENIERCQQALEVALDKELERWAITPSEKKVILQRILVTDKFDDLKTCDFVIESITENFELKANLFKTLDEIMPPEIIFATNTSTLSISALASYTKRPQKVVGMHFIYPVHRRPVVEVIRGFYTSDETVQVVRELIKSIGKIAVEAFEYPGYITTRIIIPYLNEAMYVVMEGLASAEDVDTALRLGYNLPQGPLELADHIGLDELLRQMEYLFKELGEVKYRPCPLLRKMVRAGYLGVKTRRGFFCYNERGERID